MHASTAAALTSSVRNTTSLSSDSASTAFAIAAAPGGPSVSCEQKRLLMT
jgi:hypothetical protein